MNAIFLTEFWEVLAWVVWVWLWMLVLFLFVWALADVLRRRDLGGWAKAGWIFLIFALPLIGMLIYVILRPAEATAEQDAAARATARPASAYSAAAEIEKAQQLLASGVITQAEFDRIKQNALIEPREQVSTFDVI